MQRRLRVGEVGALRREEVVSLRLSPRAPRSRARSPVRAARAAARSCVGLGAQRSSSISTGWHLGEHLVERPPPLGLEPLADRRAAARQLGEAQLGVMQLVARARATGGARSSSACSALEQRSSASRTARFGVVEASPRRRRASPRASRDPCCHAAICSASALSACDEVGQLGAERSSRAPRRRRFLREPPLAIVRDLQARLRLRLARPAQRVRSSRASSCARSATASASRASAIACSRATRATSRSAAASASSARQPLGELVAARTAAARRARRLRCTSRSRALATRRSSSP